MRLRVAISLLITLLSAAPARAATIYWGGVAGNWSSGSSWVGGTAPGSSDTASFQGYASASPTSILYTPSTYMSQSSSLMRDGNTGTYWWSGQNQASGQCIIIDLGSAKTISGIQIDAGSSYPGDYGRGYDIFVSSTSNNTCGHASWNSAIASKAGSAVTSIAFTPVTYRYVKIQLNVTANPTAWWAVGEVTVWAT
ncbi:MAG TPA: discoidin domain-containing protein, partial [Polyangia bacterium]